MDFSFTEEQNMLLETTRRFVSREYGFEARKQITSSETGMSRKTWSSLAEIGLLALLVPEENGGLEAGPVETMLVMSALGEGLVVEPFLTSAVMSTSAIARLGSTVQKEAWLPLLAGGEVTAVFAHEEKAASSDPLRINTTATPAGGGYVISGSKHVIYHAPQADLLLVSAKLPEGQLALFAIPANTPGLRMQAYPTVDGRRAADIHFQQMFVPADTRLCSADANEVIADVLDLGLAALCAEATGSLDKLLAATIEYAGARKQFGVPIGKFQALQHRMADMLIHREQARSMSYLAAIRAGEQAGAERSRALSAAKVVIGQACRFVGQQAVQIHGGMGVTDELDVSHYFKRLFAIEKLFGTTDSHLRRFSAAAS
ncbi:MAG: acyl-CoA dehydrogenase [Azoarcus sp. PHD]|nr:MAG: acyl-CoA dehydrogenase [Azoarcus sp. PHD]|tara:strand:+ start:24205 stop:25323 length:1119 start_codon:yes stop_codon:yes gene_type:complete